MGSQTASLRAMNDCVEVEIKSDLAHLILCLLTLVGVPVVQSSDSAGTSAFHNFNTTCTFVIQTISSI